MAASPTTQGSPPIDPAPNLVTRTHSLGSNRVFPGPPLDYIASKVQPRLAELEKQVRGRMTTLNHWLPGSNLK